MDQVFRERLSFLDPQEVKSSENISSLLICLICQGILIDSLECSLCSRSFCSMCLKTWHQSDSLHKCPNSCQKVTFKQPHLILRDNLERLRFNCSNGCGTELSYQEKLLNKHEYKCKLNTSEADELNEKVLKSRIFEVNCMFCLNKYSIQDIEAHEKECVFKDRVVPKVEKTCVKCKKKQFQLQNEVTFIECFRCTKNLCQSCEVDCQKCPNKFCNKCSGPCYCRGENLCLDCEDVSDKKSCFVCEENFVVGCEKCLIVRTCSTCNQKVCVKCSGTCNDCGSTNCSSCLKTCGECFNCICSEHGQTLLISMRMTKYCNSIQDTLKLKDFASKSISSKITTLFLYFFLIFYYILMIFGNFMYSFLSCDLKNIGCLRCKEKIFNGSGL